MEYLEKPNSPKVGDQYFHEEIEKLMRWNGRSWEIVNQKPKSKPLKVVK